MSDVGKAATVSRKKRWLSFVITTTLLALGLVFVAKPAFAASTYACPNGDSHTPPYNWTDRCVVLTSDRGTNFVGQMTGATDCNATPRIHTQRVRVIADYVPSGRKLLIRSIQIRYVQGSVPWAWYWVHIRDGNGMYYKRAFNNNGYTILSDNATYTADNTFAVTPSPGFAPPFGSSGLITVQVRPVFTKTPILAAGGQVECAGDILAMLFVAPV
jgi:hypothetical protein